MGGRSLTYHFPICRYIIQARAPTCPHSHKNGEEEIMGSTFVRKWGRRPDYKKEETEVEICGTLLEEESFLCHVLPKAAG